MNYSLVFIFLISVSKLYANSCGVDQTKLFCANPLEYICKDANKAKQKNLNSNLSALKDHAAKHFYKKNKELLQRHGIFDLNAASMEKIKDLFVQCHETRAEMEGVCEKSQFLGIDTRKIYASAVATGNDSGFWSGFYQQVNEQYQDYLEKIINENEDVLRDIGIGVLGHFQDAMIEQVKNYYQYRPKSAGAKIRNLKRKLQNVYFIFNRRSPEMRHFSHETKIKIISFYNVACRSMADGDNAFVFDDRETKKKAVVMCPGVYLRQGLSDLKNFNSTEVAPRILSVFTHEFAHILNSRKSKRSFIVDNFPYKLRSCHRTWFDLPEDIKNN